MTEERHEILKKLLDVFGLYDGKEDIYSFLAGHIECINEIDNALKEADEIKCPKCRKIMEERELTFVCKDCTVLLKKEFEDKENKLEG